MERLKDVYRNVRKENKFEILLTFMLLLLPIIFIIIEEVTWRLSFTLMVVVYALEKIFQLKFKDIEGKVYNFLLNNVFVILSMTSFILIKIKYCLKIDYIFFNKFKILNSIVTSIVSLIVNVIVNLIVIVTVTVIIFVINNVIIFFVNRKANKKVNETKENENDWSIYKVKIKEIES